jgi:hypothetical protein
MEGGRPSPAEVSLGRGLVLGALAAPVSAGTAKKRASQPYGELARAKAQGILCMNM